MNKYITCASDLVTSHEQTRAGFIEAALEKNKKSSPFVEQAKTLKVLAGTADKPEDLLAMDEIRSLLVTASGLSDKALQYFTEEDKKEAVKELIEKFLKPAGERFVDELVYRFLIVRGDTVGGMMRNFVGLIAKRKVTRKVMTVLDTMSIPYMVLKKDNRQRNRWAEMDFIEDYTDADNIAAITWTRNEKNRILFFDTNIPTVGNNVDICLYDGDAEAFAGGRIVNEDDRAIMFGELKGGIDPAGADEHWKTGNTALMRIRSAFKEKDITIKTSFVGAAIANNMADEIWAQLEDGTLSNAANLTSESQFTDYCEWIVKI